jgi:hypothetical protein
MQLLDVKILVRLSRRGINIGQRSSEGSESVGGIYRCFIGFSLLNTTNSPKKKIFLRFFTMDEIRVPDQLDGFRPIG